MVNGRRAKQLRKERERRARRAVPSAPMRFRCDDCGAMSTGPGGFTLGIDIVDENDRVIQPLIPSAPPITVCRSCGGTARGVNAHAVTVGRTSALGFADTEEQYRAVVEMVRRLHDLDDNATVDEVAAVLDEEPVTRPVAEYLRKHWIELASLGVGVLTLVVPMLWHLVTANDEPPQTPAGITEEQMDRLLTDFERELADLRQNPPDHADRGHRDDHHGDRQDRRVHVRDTGP